jgi:NADP-dependent 3-hydroxy acid dehydrogenase YdfG
VATELFTPGDRRRHLAEHGTYERLRPADVGDAVGYAVTRPRHVAVSEMLVRPTEQER